MITDVIDVFEDEWQTDSPPRITQFLEKLGPSERQEHFAELVAIDMEYRWRRGVETDAGQGTDDTLNSDLPPQPKLDDYRQALSGLVSFEEAPLDLIAEEYRVRHVFGDSPTHVEFQARYGDRNQELAEQLSKIDSQLSHESCGESTFAWAPSDKPRPELRQGLPEVPGFEILRIIGRGGMGVVYAARHKRLNRNVALKMLLSGQHAGPAELAQLEREAQAIAKLQHDRFVQIFEIGDFEGRPFLVLELVEGGSLARHAAVENISPRVAAEITRDLASAIHEAHEKGIVHRDLKPANILRTTSGDLKVTDFGLAKHLLEDSKKTKTGSLLGTPSYMAPEQAASSKNIGPAADIYSLGAILYELLTGKPPFHGDNTWEVVSQVINSPPTPPSKIAKAAPRDLETICLKCLEKDPANRYQSAAALADDLDRWLDGRTISARPAGPFEKAWRWARRRPAAVSLVAALLIGGAGLLSLVSSRLQHQNSRDPLPARNIELVADWRFDGRANEFRDASGRDMHAFGVLSAGTNGKHLVLDGAVQPPNLASSLRVPSLDTTAGVPLITDRGVTVFSRIKVETLNGDSPATIFAWADPGGQLPNVSLWINAERKPQLRIFRGVDYLEDSVVTSAIAIDDGFHELAVSIDGLTGHAALYIDGELSDDGSGKTGTLDIGLIRETEGYQFSIGRIANATNCFVGEIDRLLLFDGVLPASRIQSLAKDMPSTRKNAIGKHERIVNSIGMTLVKIPQGQFEMGWHGSSEEPTSIPGEHDELPRHTVRLQSFYMGAHEVTVNQFRQFVEDQGVKIPPGAGYDAASKMIRRDAKFDWNHPGWRQSGNEPVVNVSWHDAVAFCEWISRRENKAYRLPTEAEWEYACRAGSDSEYCFGDDEDMLREFANVADQSFRDALVNYFDSGEFDYTKRWNDGFPFTSPVGAFKPNRFGLFDMHGNVQEWCSDWYSADYYKHSSVEHPTGPASGTFRVKRGGDWLDYANTCRNSFRRSEVKPDVRRHFIGFRVVCEASQPE